MPPLPFFILTTTDDGERYIASVTKTAELEQILTVNVDDGTSDEDNIFV